MVRVRVRQHVNPLSARFLEPRACLLERPAGLDPDCRVEVELGCGDARFSFALAARHPDWLIVGLDIREAMLDLCRARAARKCLGNLVFAYANLAVDIEHVFAPASVDRFHLLFPDPWFKTRHHKRRVLDVGLTAKLRARLRPGGELHVSSDVFELALDAMAEIEHAAGTELGLRNLAGPWSFWRGPAFEVSSKREDMTRARGQRVWRLRYVADAAPRVASGSEIASGRAAHRS